MNGAQYFSDFSEHQNTWWPLLGLTPRASDSGDLRWGLEICISGHFPGMHLLLAWGSHFESHGRSTCRYNGMPPSPGGRLPVGTPSQGAATRGKQGGICPGCYPALEMREGRVRETDPAKASVYHSGFSLAAWGFVPSACKSSNKVTYPEQGTR